MSNKYIIMCITLAVILGLLILYRKYLKRHKNRPDLKIVRYSPLGVLLKEIKDDFFKENKDIILDEELKKLKFTDPDNEKEWEQCIENIKKNFDKYSKDENQDKIATEVIKFFDYIYLNTVKKIFENFDHLSIPNQIDRLKIAGNLMIISKNVEENTDGSFFLGYYSHRLKTEGDYPDLTYFREAMLAFFLKKMRSEYDRIMIHPKYLAVPVIIGTGKIDDFPLAETLNKYESNKYNTIKLLPGLTYRVHSVMFRNNELWAFAVSGKKNYYTNSTEKLSDVGILGR